MRLLCRVCSLGKTASSLRCYRTSSVFYKIVQFNLSDIGEGIREVTVRDWFVNVGDVVAQFENVCQVESDKASVSITSRYDGTVRKLYYEVGDTALVGKPLMDVDVADDVGSTSSSSVTSQDLPKNEPDLDGNLFRSIPTEELLDNNIDVKIRKISTELENLEASEFKGAEIGKAVATPAVRRIARENNVNIGSVKGSGKGGRVMKEDILRHIGEIPSIKKEETSLTSDKKIQITGIKKAMVKTMTKSNTIPTFGYCDEIDITNLIKLRKDVKEYASKKDINISYMPFFIKALSKALEEYPELNASVDENCEYITYKSQHNIGVAMDTEKGLIVPNIKNVQSLSVLEIGVCLNRLLLDGRSLKLGPSDMSGGTITISNIGIIGGTYLRPLILPPEVCILALGKSKLIPAFNEDGGITKKYVLNASWAADHRVIDGATLAKFSNTWKEYIENPNYLLMNL